MVDLAQALEEDLADWLVAAREEGAQEVDFVQHTYAGNVKKAKKAVQEFAFDVGQMEALAREQDKLNLEEDKQLWTRQVVESVLQPLKNKHDTPQVGEVCAVCMCVNSGMCWCGGMWVWADIEWVGYICIYRSM